MHQCKMVAEISLICIAIHGLTREGYPFHFLSKLISKLPIFVAKPLMECLPCMASVYTLSYLILNNQNILQTNTIWLMLKVFALNLLAEALLQLSQQFSLYLQGADCTEI